MQFSDAEILEAISTVTQKRGESVYTPQKNYQSYMLSLQTCPARGESIEIIIAKRLQMLGVQATHLGGSQNSIDLSVSVNGSPVRGECKSSLSAPGTGRYKFHRVKPELFDILFFAFVHPTRGVVVKTASVRDINRWIADCSPSRGEDGYSIGFGKSMTHQHIPTIEWDADGGIAKFLG